MDPKQSGTPGNLDPKLKEAYERVMGLAPNPSVQKTPATPTSTPAAQPVPQPTPAATPAPATPTPQPQPTPAAPSAMPTMQTVGTAKPNATSPVHLTSQIHGFVASKQKKKSQLSPVVIVLAAVVFIVVYTLVWVKIFNVQLPFLPQ